MFYKIVAWQTPKDFNDDWTLMFQDLDIAHVNCKMVLTVKNKNELGGKNENNAEGNLQGIEAKMFYESCVSFTTRFIQTHDIPH